MKCKYKYCKHGGEVQKSDATKVGNCYYHKDCYEEKTNKKLIEDYYLENFPSCTLVILRKVINQLINDKGNSSDFILFTLNYIKKNNKPLNNPFGLLTYCTYFQIIDEYKKMTTLDKYKSMNELEEDNATINFTYKKNDKNITDII